MSARSAKSTARPSAGRALPTATATVLLLTGLVVAAVPTGPTAATPAATAAAPKTLASATAPALWQPSAHNARRLVTPRAAAGTHQLVSLRSDLLPTRAVGQQLRLPVGSGRTLTVHLTHVQRTSRYTAWSGSLDVPLGTFTMVKVGRVFRGEINSPQGVYSLTQAQGDDYWLTAAAGGQAPSGDDSATPPLRRAARHPARHAARQATASTATSAGRRAKPKHHRKVTVDVLFGYTKRAKQVVGGTQQVRAAAALAITDTNTTFKNSGIKAKVRLAGVVRAKGADSDQVYTNFTHLFRPHDGQFDTLLKQRNRRHADIAHLFTGGPSNLLCGYSAEPRTPREARPALGVSTSFISCLQYLVTTHELGHDFGADHIDYPGVTHDSKIPGAYGWYDVAHRFLTTMGYYDPCQDQGVYDCVRIPWFSSPTNTSFNGLPIGSKGADNTRVIKKIIPLVARYAR